MKKFDHPIQTMAARQEKKNIRSGKGAYLSWWQLSLIGISSVIGAGFFLGSGLSIRAAGASVLISYLIAGVSALIVFSALAEMTVNDPESGSFRTYAKKAYGDAYAFVFGWIYWFAGLMIVSSEITALSTFTRYWLPEIPLWIFFSGYACLGIGVIMLGIKDFGTIESYLAVLKLSALLAFIVFAFLLFIGGRFGSFPLSVHSPFQEGLFPNGFLGFWGSMIFVLLSFGGIEIVGLTADRCRSKDDVSKAGYALVITLTMIYFFSVVSVLMIADWKTIGTAESPFVTALAAARISFIGGIFNLVILSAAFSTMIGALYSMTTILAALAADHDAPRLFNRRTQKDVPLYGLFLTLALLILVDVLSYFLPKSVYEYLATASGTMLLLNWLNIILSDMKNRRIYSGRHRTIPFQPYSGLLGICIIVLGITGSVFDRQQRISLIFTLVIVGFILLLYLIKKKFTEKARDGLRSD
ncbi:MULTISPECIES: amino acid permease [unclassified Sporolactobacillus]|uniref:amino acid permease n=1 Tax=unclassified Sporolactobacillus TaxID=2628533 RepID=UPI002368CE7C|nr:amino acid permease [Sporolactobacillus sp. CQH2019]MDD9147467.1 amino acid permease [Sporolactobacillus sp. CQH2019]